MKYKKGIAEWKVVASTILFLGFFLLLFLGFTTSKVLITYQGLNTSLIANTSLNQTTQEIASGVELQPFPVCKTTSIIDILSFPVACPVSLGIWFLQFIGIQTNIFWLAPFFLTLGALFLYIIARLFRGGG